MPEIIIDQQDFSSRRQNDQEPARHSPLARKALIVEDNNLNLKLFSEILRLEGFEINAARDGEEALEVLQGDAPDVILLDLQLPKKSGFSVIRELRLHNSEIPVIGVSAYARVEDRNRALSAGCDLFLTKPVAPADLIDALKSLLK